VGYFGAAGETGPQQRPDDPLLRSGLVLAGTRAQQGPPGWLPREDSLVTALELAGLDLWGTQLVVLSACDTGRGDVRLGQGVYGLRRALVVAGAESLVTSLWKVDDEVTRQLMDVYYQHLLAGEGRSAALHQAMRTLRQTHPHPYFWAPFIPIGRVGPLQGLEPQGRPGP
jgi:CHAT domain-containing protein